MSLELLGRYSIRYQQILNENIWSDLAKRSNSFKLKAFPFSLPFVFTLHLCYNDSRKTVIIRGEDSKDNDTRGKIHEMEMHKTETCEGRYKGWKHMEWKCIGRRWIGFFVAFPKLLDFSTSIVSCFCPKSALSKFFSLPNCSYLCHSTHTVLIKSHSL